MDQTEAVAVLKEKQGELSLRQFALKLKVSASYLSDIYLGKRQIGRAVLKQVGMAKTVVVCVTYQMNGKRR
jgi:hypothetical protein